MTNYFNDQFTALRGKEVVKIAAHTEGKHFMALTNDHEVYAWGNGDGGRLGMCIMIVTNYHQSVVCFIKVTAIHLLKKNQH